MISTLSTTEDTEEEIVFRHGLNLRVPRVRRGRDCRGGELVVFEVTGTGFLRHMVRIIVGSLMEVGRGRQPVEWISDVIASGNRAMAGPTAPPDGLFLVRVEYPDALAAGS